MRHNNCISPLTSASVTVAPPTRHRWRRVESAFLHSACLAAVIIFALLGCDRSVVAVASADAVHPAASLQLSPTTRLVIAASTSNASTGPNPMGGNFTTVLDNFRIHAVHIVECDVEAVRDGTDVAEGRAARGATDNGGSTASTEDHAFVHFSEHCRDHRIFLEQWHNGVGNGNVVTSRGGRGAEGLSSDPRGRTFTALDVNPTCVATSTMTTLPSRNRVRVFEPTCIDCGGVQDSCGCHAALQDRHARPLADVSLGELLFDTQTLEAPDAITQAVQFTGANKTNLHHGHAKTRRIMSITVIANHHLHLTIDHPHKHDDHGAIEELVGLGEQTISVHVMTLQREVSDDAIMSTITATPRSQQRRTFVQNSNSANCGCTCTCCYDPPEPPPPAPTPPPATPPPPAPTPPPPTPPPATPPPPPFTPPPATPPPATPPPAVPPSPATPPPAVPPPPATPPPAVPPPPATPPPAIPPAATPPPPPAPTPAPPEPCTNSDCNGHATSVDGDYPWCSCTCSSAWTGSSCQTSNVCTNSADCNSRALTVGGNRPSCACNCAPEWTGSSCQTSNVCTNTADCSGHATAVSGNRPACSCTCPAEWIGSHCEISNVCTNAADCSGHAVGVAGNRPSCTCTCPGEWIGAQCEVSNVCTSAADCNGRAGRVVGNRPACTCYCLAAYKGSVCEVTRTLTPSTSTSVSLTMSFDLSGSGVSATATPSNTLLASSSRSHTRWSHVLTATVSGSVTASGTLSPTRTPTKSADLLSATVSRSATSSRSTSLTLSRPAISMSLSVTTSQSTSASNSLTVTPSRQSFSANATATPSASFTRSATPSFTVVSVGLPHNGTSDLTPTASQPNTTLSASPTVTATLVESPSATPSATCTASVHLSVRAPAELLGNEAGWCAVANATNASTCIVVASEAAGLQHAVIAKASVSGPAPPVFVVVPFTLNATDWRVELARVEQPNLDAGAGGGAASRPPTPIMDEHGPRVVYFEDVSDTQRNRTTGTVVLRLGAVPLYGAVHEVQLGCHCGGRYETATLTARWSAAPALISTSQGVFAGAATVLGPLTGDASAAVALALISSLTCAGEPLTSASFASYFVSVFVDYGAAAFAVGNLGLAAAFLLLHALVGAVVRGTHLRRNRGPATLDDESSSTSSSLSLELAPRWLDAFAAVRAPSLSILFAQLMLPGAVYGALASLSGGTDAVTGAVALVLVVATLGAMVVVLVRVVLPRATFEEYPLPRPSGSALEVRLRLLPRWRWGPRAVVKAFAPLMSSRTRRWALLSQADVVLTCCLAAASGLGVGTRGGACAYAPLTIAALYFAYAAVLVALRPHRLPCDVALAPVSSLCFGALCVVKYAEADAAALETVLSVVQMAQMALRLLVMLREWQWRRLEAELPTPSELHLGTDTDDDQGDILGTTPTGKKGSPRASTGAEAEEEEDAFWDENGNAIGFALPPQPLVEEEVETADAIGMSLAADAEVLLFALPSHEKDEAVGLHTFVDPLSDEFTAPQHTTLHFNTD